MLGSLPEVRVVSRILVEDLIQISSVVKHTTPGTPQSILLTTDDVAEHTRTREKLWKHYRVLLRGNSNTHEFSCELGISRMNQSHVERGCCVRSAHSFAMLGRVKGRAGARTDLDLGASKSLQVQESSGGCIVSGGAREMVERSPAAFVKWKFQLGSRWSFSEA